MNKALFLFEAEQKKTPVVRFTAKEENFSLGEGYSVQDELLGLHEKFGAKLVGWKMGMTSLAKMQQMKIDAPIHGFLTNKMAVPSGGKFSLRNSIHAKVEPEIAFVVEKELKGSPSLEQALASVKVAGALEIIDSRYENYDFHLPDVVADNCSSSGFVLGSTLLPALECPDLDNLGIVLEQDGAPMQFGSSAAILGHPGRSLVSLVKLLHGRGRSLPPGSVVLAGGATAAIPLVPGNKIQAKFQHLGVVAFEVTP